MDDPRVIKPKLPVSVVISAVLIGLLVLIFVLFAVGYTGYQVQKSKMPGIIVSKEFIPGAEKQIIVGRKGELKAKDKKGDYILTVEVAQPDGTKKPYEVWVDEKDYDRLKVGDKFDVGPYLVKE